MSDKLSKIPDKIWFKITAKIINPNNDITSWKLTRNEVKYFPICNTHELYAGKPKVHARPIFPPELASKKKSKV